ncbi:MAG: hypothetical protein ABFD92_08405 [Planctomycetaceae bacterium]|nr:hypothetical protein [Planctomycetaceae bacterium]
MTNKKVFLAAVILAITPICAAADLPAKHRTDWFHEARWGVMYHFVATWLKIEDRELWNKTLREFDTDGLAQQLADVKAGYLVITATHYGFPLCPNAQDEGGKLPAVDLIPRLADSLAKKNIRLMLYYPTGMGGDGWQRSEKVIRELSLRYGNKVSGWWLDNNSMFQEDRQKAIAAAARAGNPDAILAFAGPKRQQRNSPYEDFAAGNTRPAREGKCYGRFIEGVQWHMLSHLALSWCTNWKEVETRGDNYPRFSDAEAAAMTAAIAANGGVTTWDTPPMRTGLINPKFLAQLKAIGEKTMSVPRNPDPLAALDRPKMPNIPPVPAAAAGATITTLAASHCRIADASNFRPADRCIGRLATSVGTQHHHFIRGFLQFDLSKIDRSKPLHSAVLYLHLNETGLAPFAGSPLVVSRLAQPLDAAKPYETPIVAGGEAVADDRKAGPVAVDVTEIVKAWLSGAPNCGLRLSASGLGGNWTRYPLTTKEYQAGAYEPKTNPNAPRLEIRQ